MVDASDRSRLPESRAELDALLTDEQLSACPVLILGNKIDKPGAASEDELRNFFNLFGQTTGKVINCNLYITRICYDKIIYCRVKFPEVIFQDVHWNYSCVLF